MADDLSKTNEENKFSSYETVVVRAKASARGDKQFSSVPRSR